jgi:hypothetical protein
VTCIEEKFMRLSPAGKGAAEAFIDFLLSREKREENDILGEDEEDRFWSHSPESAKPTPDIPVLQPANTKIILAEERMIEEKDDLIDFADINTRFTQKDSGIEKPRPVRQPKKLDWI